jgi:hypothetical protein
MTCDDFYEGQARLDGAFCDYSKEVARCNDSLLVMLLYTYMQYVMCFLMEFLYINMYIMIIQDKMAFLARCHENGVVNIEMEVLAFGAILHHAKIPAAAMCVTLLVCIYVCNVMYVTLCMYARRTASMGTRCPSTTTSSSSTRNTQQTLPSRTSRSSYSNNCCIITHSNTIIVLNKWKIKLRAVLYAL